MYQLINYCKLFKEILLESELDSRKINVDDLVIVKFSDDKVPTYKKLVPKIFTLKEIWDMAAVTEIIKVIFANRMTSRYTVIFTSERAESFLEILTVVFTSVVSEATIAECLVYAQIRLRKELSIEEMCSLANIGKVERKRIRDILFQKHLLEVVSETYYVKAFIKSSHEEYQLLSDIKVAEKKLDTKSKQDQSPNER